MAQFNLNPIDNFYGILAFLTDTVNTLLAEWGMYLRYGSLGIAAVGILLAILTFLDTRSYTYYLTNKRVIGSKEEDGLAADH